MSLIGETKEEILLHLESVDEDYGYSMSQELNLPLPSVYEHLQDLEEEDILWSQKKGRQRVYQLTEDGHKLVEVIT